MPVFLDKIFIVAKNIRSGGAIVQDDNFNLTVEGKSVDFVEDFPQQQGHVPIVYGDENR
jgi:hypothetical protein